ncbi:nuclear transport factor 2 family protein [Sphingomonas sp.]|uniref:nuclear transport factor 2 family protein n=1 Tax=Sphingomonas sp. TaxID=28214 RepID=UPI002DD62862|nr:nuclear transport factor 2 family protein [Sphingomonas sp.]
MDTIARWHLAAQARDPALLDDLIAEECVMLSPAVHTPQTGKAITIKYLSAAMAVLAGPDFRYTGEWRGERSAILEFETMVDGMAVNGVDIIRWGEDGRIVEFKVMARPLKGLTALIPAMAAQLQG